MPARTCDSSVTSIRKGLTVTRRASHCRRKSSSSRAVSTAPDTFQPEEARCSAHSRPRPDPAPVTTATDNPSGIFRLGGRWRNAPRASDMAQDTAEIEPLEQLPGKVLAQRDDK